MTFERGPRAERDDRRPVCRAKLHDGGNFFGTTGKGDRVGGMRRMIGFVLAMLGANRRRGGEAIAEVLTQRGEKGLVDNLTTKDGCKHGGSRRHRKHRPCNHYSPGCAAATAYERPRSGFGRTKAPST